MTAAPFDPKAAVDYGRFVLQLTSWRIVNAQDIIPMLPPELLGFTHVATEQKFSSIGKVWPSFACWHALATYLHLIDPALQPGPDCQLTGPRAAAPTTVSTLSVPAGPVSVNITINVGK